VTEPSGLPSNCSGSGYRQEPNGEVWGRSGCREHTIHVPNPSGWDPALWPAPAPRFPTRTFEAEPVSSPPGLEQYAGWMHGTGSALAEGWHANPNVHAPGGLLYGPYVTVNSDVAWDPRINGYSARRTASFTAEVDYTGDGLSIGSVDVYNYTNGAVVSGPLNLPRSHFASAPGDLTRGRGPYAYRDFDLTFYPQPSKLYEFRFAWLRNTWTRVDRVRIAEPRDMWSYNMPELSYTGADPQLSHGPGQPGPNGSWDVLAGSPAPATIIAGPYTFSVLPGHRQV